MKTFSGSLSNRLMLTFFCVLQLGCLYFVFDPPNKSNGVSMLLVRLTGGLLFGSAELFALYGLIESFTVYGTDQSSITRRAWNGMKRLEWRNLTRYAANGQRDGTIKLVDHRGEQMSVYFSLLGGNATRELRGVIEANLTTQHEKQLDEIGTLQKVWHPSRKSGVTFLITLLLFASLCLYVSSMPVTEKDRVFVLPLIMMLTVIGVSLLGLIVYSFTHKLTVSRDGLTDEWLLRTKIIPFSKVTSVMSGIDQMKSGTMEVTTLEGDGQKITLQSTMNDYPLLLAFIHKNVAQPAAERGEIAATEAKRKQEKQARIFTPIGALFCFFLLGGFGLYLVRDGNKHIAPYRLMDTQEHTTTGQITGRGTKGSKTTRYTLDFAFDAGGIRIDSTSPVTREEYYSTRIGSAASVIYVPGQPDICRLTESIGRRSAEADIRQGYTDIVLACVLTPLLALSPFFKRKKTNT